MTRLVLDSGCWLFNVDTGRGGARCVPRPPTLFGPATDLCHHSRVDAPIAGAPPRASWLAGVGCWQSIGHGSTPSSVRLRSREAEDLDWKEDLAWQKKELPPDKKDEKKDEFAKDVAAMANTRGGLIIFGGKEHNEEATELADVANDERERVSARRRRGEQDGCAVSGRLAHPLDD